MSYVTYIFVITHLLFILFEIHIPYIFGLIYKRYILLWLNGEFFIFFCNVLLRCWKSFQNIFCGDCALLSRCFFQKLALARWYLKTVSARRVLKPQLILLFLSDFTYCISWVVASWPSPDPDPVEKCMARFRHNGCSLDIHLTDKHLVIL